MPKSWPKASWQLNRRHCRPDRLGLQPAANWIQLAARIRAFTNYLPGFNIPMLPRELSDDLCSLRANDSAPGSGCARTEHYRDGTIEADDAPSLQRLIESKAKLAYDNVSDWLEGTGDWQPENDAIAEANRIYCIVFV